MFEAKTGIHTGCLIKMKIRIEHTLLQALEAHKVGKLQDAEALYRAILQVQPRHPDANHNLGVLAVSLNKSELALPLFKTALEVNSKQVHYWISYFDALIKTNQLEIAKNVFEKVKNLGLAVERVDALEAQLTPKAIVEKSESILQKKPSSFTQQRKKVSAKKEKRKKENLSSNLTNSNQVRSPSTVEVNGLQEHYQKGRFDLAENLAKTITQKYPDYQFSWKVLGEVFKKTGRLQESLIANQRAVEISPNDAEAHYNLGLSLQLLGRLVDSEASYSKAIALMPDLVEAHYNLGLSLQELDRLKDAEASFGKAIAIKPEYAEAHNNLGSTQQKLGRLKDAEASYSKAITIKPEYAEAHYNLGLILQELGRPEDAKASYSKAIAIKPDLVEAHYNLGLSLQELDRLKDAEASFGKAIAIKPEYAEAHNNLGSTLLKLGRLKDAEASYSKAIAVKPGYAEAYSNLGSTQQKLGRLQEAETSYSKAIAIKPEYAEAHSNLGVTLQELGRPTDAIASYSKAIAIKPNLAEVHSNLGVTLQSLGMFREAEDSYLSALRIDPNYADAFSNFLLSRIQNESINTTSLFEQHRAFGERFEAPLRSGWLPHKNLRDPDRSLRIGFVSGDFRLHAVANFILPVMIYLARYSQLSLHAYYNHVAQDTLTDNLKGYFECWHPIVGLSDADVAKKIRADCIDILIDLSGHTANNRLLTFARKPAPVQVSWIGYPSTTGLMAMDYYLGDRFLFPLGEFEKQFTEKIVRLPATVPFQVFTASQSINPLPALKNGYVTFGSFNRLSKISRSTIALWSQLLDVLPNSRLLMGGMPEAGNYEQLIEWFAQEGIDRQRISFFSRCKIDVYLRLHHQVDICLDTFPYGGGTTTYYAIWMGVPTITCAGKTMPSRVGAAVQSHLDLEDFVANTRSEFVEKGMYWAEHLAELAVIRDGLRKRFEQSAIGNPSVIATAIESAFRLMWKRWCADLPAESFEVSSESLRNVAREATQ